MFKFAASVFTGFAALFHGFIGGGATTTPPMNPPYHQEITGSSTPHDRMNMGSTTPHKMGTSTPDMRRNIQNRNINGTVSTISGNILTIERKMGTSTAATLFSVDATNAHIIKGTTTDATIANIAVGDHVNVMGTTTGNSVIADLIVDILPMPRPQNGTRGPGMPIRGTSTPPRPQAQ